MLVDGGGGIAPTRHVQRAVDEEGAGCETNKKGREGFPETRVNLFPRSGQGQRGPGTARWKRRPTRLGKGNVNGVKRDVEGCRQKGKDAGQHDDGEEVAKSDQYESRQSHHGQQGNVDEAFYGAPSPGVADARVAGGREERAEVAFGLVSDFGSPSSKGFRPAPRPREPAHGSPLGLRKK